MSRTMQCLCLVGCLSWTLAFTLAADKPNAEKPAGLKPNGNRLTYLDEPCNPYYVHRDFPKLTTPMWVGEEGVEAVVILGIDDMRGHEKWEAYLRPILNRLKQIDGRAPVSIMTCSIDPKHPHLQQWLEEGLSLEVHTVDHPCPLLGGMKGLGVRGQGPGGSNDVKLDAAPLDSRLSPLVFSKDTYDRCIDLLNEVPNNKPVCFRMPCCDSLNTLSPRFFTEIFAKSTEKGHFLQADSSVFNVFTSDDPALPRELVLERADATRRTGGASPLVDGANGDGQDTRGLTPPVRPDVQRERFRKYIPTDRFFANTIENYPYPYVIDRLCWEFPCVTPSDWSAQHLHKPHNPQTVEDWKAALDCTVIKQGVFCLVFHPHNWIKPEQVNDFIDHAVTKHGKKVKFLTFKEAVERLNKNVLSGQTLRDAAGNDNGMRLLDINDDGFLDFFSANSNGIASRVWSTQSKSWQDVSVPEQLSPSPVMWFGILGEKRRSSVFVMKDLGHCNTWQFDGERWVALQKTESLDDVIAKDAFAEFYDNAPHFRFQMRDLDGDGRTEFLMVGQSKDNGSNGSLLLRWSDLHKTWLSAGFLPSSLDGSDQDRFADDDLKALDAGLRFVDIDQDGHDDAILSDGSKFCIRLFDPAKGDFTRELLAGQRGSKPANEELPPIVRADGSNNGFWVHSRNLVWMNEDTAKSKDLVERRSFDELLARGGVRGVRCGSPDPAAKPTEGLPEGTNRSKAKDSKQPRDLRSERRRGQETRAEPVRSDDGPRSPEESLKLMQVKPGYRVELVAAEPLVRDPVAFDWGPDGKLWVAEMADYPLGVPNEESDTDNMDVTEKTNKNDSEPKPSVISVSSVSQKFDFKKGGGRVRILEDTDGDGQYDKSTVFLDKLNFPNGVMPWRDGVLISAAPDVLFARDTNGDNKADEVKVLLTGFGEGNQQHRVNGFSWGLDNMVHCANGDSGGSITVVASLRDAKSKPETTTKSESRSDSATFKTIDIRGRDFRWNPDTGELDPTSGQTQFGRNRDDFGNWFGNNNSNPMYHFVLDDYYIRRNPHVAPPDPKKQVSVTPGPSPVFPISRTLARFNDFAMANRFTSANSTMVYRDELLFVRSPLSVVSGKNNGQPTTDKGPRTMDQQHVFISEPVHNLVHHEVMTADGVTFTSRRPDDEQQSEFLASKDNWFRPTQIKTGPDGALYIADMYRQVIEHPQYIPPAMQEKLDLRAGHDKGRIYRVVCERECREPNAGSWPLANVIDRDLLAALDSPNGAVRDLAHRMIYWELSAEPSEFFVESLHMIVREGWLKAGTVSADLIINRIEATWRAQLHALALLEAFCLQTPEDISAALQNQHPAIRRRALQAIESFEGQLPDPLINQLLVMSRDPDPIVRMQFAYTLGHPRFTSLGNELGKLLYRERDDKYLVAAAMSSIHAKNVGSVVANYLEISATDKNASHGNDSPTGNARRGATSPTLTNTLLNLAATLGEDQALLSLIEYVLSGAATSEAQPVMLATVLETLDRRGTSLSKLNGIEPQRLVRAEKQLEERIEAARAVISNLKSQISDSKSDLVIASLPLLGRVSAQRGDDAKLIGELLIPQIPVPVQSAAITALARINHANTGTALLSGWKMLTPSLRQQVLDALLSRATWSDQLLEQVAAKTISPAEIDAVRRQRLIGHSNETIRTRAAKLFEATGSSDRQKVVADFAGKLKELKQPGDATRGAEIFKQWQCATCHKLRDIGTPVGPDLVSLTDKSVAALLTAILDPNKAVEAKYLAYTAVTKDGRTVNGMIVSETGNSITFAGPDGKPVTLLRADIDEFIASNKSFMPEGLEKSATITGSETLLSAEAMSDLIAFIQSTGPSPKKFNGNQPEVVQQAADGSLRLLATNAEIHGKTLVFEPQFKNLGYWGSVDDRAVWTIRVSKPGPFSIRLNYACDNSAAGNEVVFLVGDQVVKAKVVGTGSWENYQTAILGGVTLSAGEHRFTVRASESLKNHLLDLRELRLQAE